MRVCFRAIDRAPGDGRRHAGIGTMNIKSRGETAEELHTATSKKSDFAL